MRAVTWLVWLAACASGREVSTLRYVQSPDCAGCAVAIGESRFEPPDAERAPPADPGTVARAQDPEPTCGLVAEALVAIELGNYVDAEARAPKLVEAERQCRQGRLSRDRRQCLVDAYDRATIAYCVPAMAPEIEVHIATAGECEAIEERTHAALAGASAYPPATWQPNLAVLMASCKQDRWTQPMATCAAAQLMALYPQNCQVFAPPGLWRKLEARFARARETRGP